MDLLPAEYCCRATDQQCRLLLLLLSPLPANGWCSSSGSFIF
jgi:hypothetical protein